MAVTQENPAPYAPASVILDLIDRCRNRGLPSPVDSEVLSRVGVSDSLIPRTLQALRALELISDEGKHTETFESIRKAPEPQYKERLSEWLKGVYADVFSYVDPAEDDETAIRDAFRSYNPVGQQPRMVTLFIGLRAAAGLTPEKTTQVRPPRAPRQQNRPRQTGARQNSSSARESAGQKTPPGLPPPIAGLLASLPLDGRGWTKIDRDKFVNLFGATLDYCIPVVKKVASDTDGQDEGET